MSEAWGSYARSVITYLCPSLPVEHRPSMTPCHRTLFWAVLAIPDQLFTCCFCSASVSGLQLLRSRHLFPCGLQVRAWSVELDSWGCVWSSLTSSAVSVWPLVPVPLAPIELHFGSSPAIGFCGCTSDKCWRMSRSFVASSVLSAMSDES